MVSILNLAELTAAIQIDCPEGSDLRKEDFAHSLYHKIKDARTAARAIERQQIQGVELSIKPDWSIVYKFALQAMASQTKDLEIAAWLTEALLRDYGFAGLRDGFRLIKELITLYWDELYPLPDEDGLITRLAPLVGLNGEETEGTLIVPMALVPLTQGRSIGPFSLWQYQQAVEIIKITDNEKRNQRLAAGAITFEMIAQAVMETSVDFFQNQLQELESYIEEFQALTQLLEQKAGSDAPPSSRILTQLTACADCIKVIAKDMFTNEVVSSNVADAKRTGFIANSTDTNILISSTVAAIDSSISNTHDIHDLTQRREQILKSLVYAADYFRHSEPHSPISYLLERAVKWSKLPLPVLLKELIKDEQALGHFRSLTGVNVDS